MLILTRKPGESLYIGDNVKVTIVEIKGNQIRVGIDAPSELRIYREEIYLQILDENRKAAEAEMTGSALDQLSGSWKGVARTVQPEVRSPRTSKSPSTTPSQVEPRVFVKRKKRRDEDEDGESPPKDGEER
jgi:carbon storage regulator